MGDKKSILFQKNSDFTNGEFEFSVVSSSKFITVSLIGDGGYCYPQLIGDSTAVDLEYDPSYNFYMLAEGDNELEIHRNGTIHIMVDFDL